MGEKAVNRTLCYRFHFFICWTFVLTSGPDHDSGLLPRSLSVIFNNIEGRQYERSDLKPQRCRDFTRLTPDQQVAESNSRKNLLRLFKEVTYIHKHTLTHTHTHVFLKVTLFCSFAE